MTFFFRQFFCFSFVAVFIVSIMSYITDPEQYSTSLLVLTPEKKWFIQFFVGILLCVNNGACFCFALFSDNFRREPFNFSQSEITAIVTVGVFANYFSFPTGFLYDKKGPTPTLLAGTFFSATGWLGLGYLFRSSDLTQKSLLAVLFFYSLSQFSASFFETGTILTNLKAFSCYSGRVVMIQKTFMGLGTSLLAQIYFIFFQHFDSMTPFFYFLALYSTAVGTLSFFYVTVPTDKNFCLGLNVLDKKAKARGGESQLFKRPFNIGTSVLLSSVVVLLGMSMAENFFSIGTEVKVIFGVLSILSVVSFLLMVGTTPNYLCNISGFDVEAYISDEQSPTNYNGDLFCEVNTAKGVHSTISPSSAMSNSSINIEIVEAEENISRVPFYLKHFLFIDKPLTLNSDTFIQNIRKYDIWLLWFSCFASWSAMTLISSNVTQIYQALAMASFNPRINAAYVSLFGVASALGRIIVGFIHPFLQRKNISITALVIIPPIVNIVGLPLFFILPLALLFIPFFLSGLATGLSWGIAILVITSIFAPNNCGKHYSLLHSAGMVSALFINIVIFGPIYDYYATQQSSGSHFCEGAICVLIPLVVCFILNCLAVPTSALFSCRIVKNGGL